MRNNLYVDGLGLVEGHFSGIGQYILGILRGMDDICDKLHYTGEPMPDIRVIIPYDTVAKFDSFGFKHIKYKRFPLSFRVMSKLWHIGKMPPIDLFCGRGTYLFTRFVSMPLVRSKSAIIIYDISFELYRQYSDEGNAKFLSAAVKRSISQAQTDRIITISENAKREIADFYNLPKEKVVVATPATDPKIFYRRSEAQIADAKRTYGIEGDYILALSNLEPRKNLISLVDAYCMLPADYRKNTKLLLVGVSGWKTDALFQHIVKKVSEGFDIIRPSHYVHDDDKPAIISGATMLVYPSHYEGFGMPPLEALACGVPVITANNSSLPEVVGDVGTMVDSEDTTALSHSIQDYLKNIDDITQATKKSGPDRADLFSWEKSAQIILRTLEEID